MPKQSAGILLYRINGARTEVFLVHPGGPYWAKKDIAGWSMPKGELVEGEEPLAGAQREFKEETGHELTGLFSPLGTLRPSGGKVIHAWAHRGDCDPATIVSNTIEIEWPPRSGKRLTIPEVDRAAWFSLDQAAVKLHRGQVEFLARLETLIGPEGKNSLGSPGG
jgi:predicted NUDIX family NTP pyrophosphohydrolase